MRTPATSRDKPRRNLPPRTARARNLQVLAIARASYDFRLIDSLADQG